MIVTTNPKKIVLTIRRIIEVMATASREPNVS